MSGAGLSVHDDVLDGNAGRTGHIATCLGPRGLDAGIFNIRFSILSTHIPGVIMNPLVKQRKMTFA